MFSSGRTGVHGAELERIKASLGRRYFRESIQRPKPAWWKLTSDVTKLRIRVLRPAEVDVIVFSEFWNHLTIFRRIDAPFTVLALASRFDPLPRPHLERPTGGCGGRFESRTPEHLTDAHPFDRRTSNDSRTSRARNPRDVCISRAFRPSLTLIKASIGTQAA